MVIFCPTTQLKILLVSWSGCFEISFYRTYVYTNERKKEEAKKKRQNKQITFKRLSTKCNAFNYNGLLLLLQSSAKTCSKRWLVKYMVGLQYIERNATKQCGMCKCISMLLICLWLMNVAVSCQCRIQSRNSFSIHVKFGHFT